MGKAKLSDSPKRLLARPRGVYQEGRECGCPHPDGASVGHSVRESDTILDGLHAGTGAASGPSAGRYLLMRYLLDTNICIYSNNSPSPLMDTLMPCGFMVPRFQEMCILQTYS